MRYVFKISGISKELLLSDATSNVDIDYDQTSAEDLIFGRRGSPYHTELRIKSYLISSMGFDPLYAVNYTSIGNDPYFLVGGVFYNTILLDGY
jgi:hypothetical protein